jgi:hypothetical protein
MDPRTTIAAFDAYLAVEGQKIAAVIIGGTALALMGVVNRPTRDCDVLCPPIEPGIARLAASFAKARQKAGDPLAEDWWNNGPAHLISVLPSGWQGRLVVVFDGRALLLRTLGRMDLLCTKLFALCDRGTDLGDCRALFPTVVELDAALPWLELQDLNPEWPRHVREVVADLKRRLGHEL